MAETHGGGGFALLLLGYRQGLESLASALPAYGAQLAEGARLAPAELVAALARVTAGTSPLLLVLGTAAILLGGLAARHLARTRLQPRAASSPLGAAAWGAMAEFLGLAAFALVTLAAALIVVPAAGPAQTFVLTYVTAGLCTLAAASASRIIFAPATPAKRLLPLADEAARFLHRWLVGLANFSSFAWLTAALLILSGMPLPVHLVLVLAIGAITAAMIMAMILHGRRLLTPLARAWTLPAILYVLAIFALWAESILARRPSAVWAAIGSIVLVAALPLADRLARLGIARLFVGESGEATRYGEALRRALRVALALALVVLIPNLWGLDLLELAGAPGAEVVSRALFDIAITGLLALLVWQLADAALERRFGMAEAGHPAAARVRTVKPLIRKFVLGVLSVVWVLIALSAIGVDIGPLLAGAGVIGLALGFGAQTLVRDVVSGIFFLWDDAFRVGEYVETDKLRGTVEAISIRSLKLRHHRGPLHTIPFGELKALTNHSRDWVIVKMNLMVTYDTDVDLVKKVLKGIGKELAKDPEFGPHLLESLKSQGIYQAADHGLLIRAKFTAKPGEQFAIRREAYKRIKLAFEEHGIRFAYPTVTIAASAVGASNEATAPALTEAAASTLLARRQLAQAS
jgi:moderate conductance mechanosensitive channel